MCKIVELRISIGLLSIALAIRDQPRRVFSVAIVIPKLSSSSIRVDQDLTEKIGPPHIILVSDLQVYSVRKFHTLV